MSRRFLSFLGTFWLLWLAFHVGRVAFGSPALSEAQFDATAQLLQSDPAVADEPVQARLQIALLQMAAHGPETAVLCATSVPLLRDALRRVSLIGDWRSATSWLEGYVDQAWWDQTPLQAGEFRSHRWNVPATFGDLERHVVVELRWRGLRQGRDCLHVATSTLLSADSNWGRRRLTDRLPSLALRRDEPYFVWVPDSGAVLALCVQDAAAPAAPWITRARWRQAARASLGAELPGAADLAAEPDDPAVGYVAFATERSRAVASVVFLDPDLSPGRAVTDSADLVGTLPGVGKRRNSDEDDLPLELRSTCLQQSVPDLQAAAAPLIDFYALELVRFAEVPVAAAVTDAWAQVQREAREQLWPAWLRWLPRPLRWLLLLAPIGPMVWMSLRMRRAPGGSVRLGGGALFLLASFSWLSLMPSLPVRMLGGSSVLLMLLVMAARRLSATTPRVERTLLACALGGSWLLLLWFSGLAPMLDGTPMEPLVDYRMSMWLLVGGWVLLDGTWRWPQVFAVSLLTDVVMSATWFALGDPGVHGLMGLLVFVMWGKALIFATFLVGGRQRAPLPVASPAVA
ncbi:MAG: hypothetical protein H6838_19660 [Planctomycetes bacterium]|nr:hypothetical protein [Planctomycetota bacterium]